VTFETNHFSEYMVLPDQENPCFTNHCTIPFKQDYLIQNDIPRYNSAIPKSPQSIYLEVSGWGGWNFNYSSYQKDLNFGPIGYPHILFGKNPCSELPSTNADLPCQLNSISNLYVEFDAEFNYTSDKEDHNLVFDIWLTNSKTPTESNITGEIMIWDYKGNIGLPDSKTYINSINIGSIRYDLWKYDHGTYPGCEVYNFLPANSQTNTRNRKINISDFMSALILFNQLQSDQKYLSSITFGNEIWYGSGSVKINKYKVSLNKISDVEGNIYKIVRIGARWWMAENLRTTRYQNGDLIGTSNPINLDLTSTTNPKYQWAYGGNESNASTYGRLYTWHALTDSRNLCPEGWHVPSDDEWHTLALYLDNNATLEGIESEIAGGKLKETGTVRWKTPNY
jgi:uncharacterized protein (TIGR02145 family)